MSGWFVFKAYAVQIIPPIAPMSLPFNIVVSNVITTLLQIAGIIATIFLIYAGILYITAGGDATKATMARAAIVNAVIGIIIIIIAFSITYWVTNMLQTGKP